MSKFNNSLRMKVVQEDLRKEVKEIINLKRTQIDDGTLSKYFEEDINDARVYLRKNKIRRGLEMRLEKELKQRLECRSFVKLPNNSLLMWFPRRWEAVRALFGKGTMDLSDPETISLLDSIDPKWAEKGN